MTSKEDLGIKVGTPTEVKWTELLETNEANLIAHKINQRIAEVNIKLAKEGIEEEKKKI